MKDQLFPAFGCRPWVMGILNVTPDSFSDGGNWADTDSAVQRGLTLLEQGADLIDIGGESTRPGAHRVDPEIEAARVLPVISELSAAGAICSVDTTRPSIASAAIKAGAHIINDVSGGLADPDMFHVAADTGVPLVLMHWRGHSDRMGEYAHYEDVTRDVRVELLRQVELALAAGVDRRSLILDPGLGFAKTGRHNWSLLHHLRELTDGGLPVLVGASRKRFLGEALATDAGQRPPAEREVATAATSMIAAQAGAWGVRVHEPRPSRDVFTVIESVAAGDDRHPDVGTAGGLTARASQRPLVLPAEHAGAQYIQSQNTGSKNSKSRENG